MTAYTEDESDRATARALLDALYASADAIPAKYRAGILPAIGCARDALDARPLIVEETDPDAVVFVCPHCATRGTPETFEIQAFEPGYTRWTRGEILTPADPGDPPWSVRLIGDGWDDMSEGGEGETVITCSVCHAVIDLSPLGIKPEDWDYD